MAQRREGSPPGGPPPGGVQALRRALVYLRSYWRDALGSLLALLLVTAASLTMPQLIRLAVDQGVAQQRAGAIATAAVGLVVVALVRGVCTFLQGFLAERASQGVAYNLRDLLFAKLQRLSFTYYDQVATGQLLTRVTNDVEQIRAFAGSGVIQIVSAVVTLLGTTVLLFSLNWRLALVALATIVPIMVLLARFVQRIGPLFGRVQGTLDRLNSILREDLAGVRTIRAFGREAYETRRYASANDELLARNLETVRALSNNFPFVFLLANLDTLAVIWYGGLQAIGGQLTIGELIAFNTYLGFLLFPILTIGFQAAGISRAGASALRVFEIVDAPLDVQEQPGAPPLPPIDCCFELRNVHFRYPGSELEVLRGVSFRAEPGQTVAILGTTGSGKSTLVNLLPRFYDVTDGSVTLDGHDVRTVTLASLRAQIAIVLQEPFLFSGTIAENIGYGMAGATREQIEAAARAVDAHGFIATLPGGYETKLGEGGTLSQGQRQLLTFARAVLADPRILILDEATSAIDTRTEALIQRALAALLAGRTSVVIAHRLSTIRNADLILVIDEGRIVERGTHETLLAANGPYAALYRRQFKDPVEVAG